MKLQFSVGKGSSPRYVSELQRRGDSARIVLRNPAGTDSVIECVDSAELNSNLEALISEGVPFSVGGMSPGPSDALHHWFLERGASVGYLEISWRGPGEWVVREIVDGAAEWQEVSLGVLLANHSLQARRP